MSEAIKHHEKHESHEDLANDKHLENLERKSKEAAAEAHEKHSKTDIEALKRVAQESAQESHSVKVESDVKEQDVSFGAHHHLKKLSYTKLLNQTRSQLPKFARPFSKFTHAKIIDPVSAVGAQTIARPSGLFGGGVGAFAGSLLLLYMAKQYGFTYNYGVFIAFFVLGFVVGVVLELLFKAFARRNS